MGNVTIDFNDKTIGNSSCKSLVRSDGTPNNSTDPTNAGNKAVNIVTTKLGYI